MTDIEITKEFKMKNIKDIAKDLKIEESDIEQYGNYKAKINYKNYKNNNKSKLILVTATSPTPYGEGKTTISIGLTDSLNKLNKKAIGVLREPSQGPVFGLKGGATGGGYAQVVPMEDINLFFTGDFYAIEQANNLLCAAIDNHIKFGNELDIDYNNICFNRCIDMNDRALRNIHIALGKETNGMPRKESFNITAASEIMSILCMSTSIEDLKNNLDNILIGYNTKKEPIFAKDLKVTSAMLVLLKDAIKPNLVQTLYNNPVLIHGGPFANISHGCNSIIATKLGMSLADYTITEAGFGADLGAEKFFDIKCRKANIKPDCIVLVTTIKALKYNANVEKEKITEPNLEKLKEGMSNLIAHIENLSKQNTNIVVAINKYKSDTLEELNYLKEYLEENNIKSAICSAYEDGDNGCVSLAEKVIEITEQENDFKYMYDINLSIREKIEILCIEIYKARSISFSKKALESIKLIEKINKDKLPICVAKTQYSISDDPTKLGYPTDNDIEVKDIILYSGAGFITVLLKDIIRMPGLPKKANFEKIDVDKDGNIIGLF